MKVADLMMILAVVRPMTIIVIPYFLVPDCLYIPPKELWKASASARCYESDFLIRGPTGKGGKNGYEDTPHTFTVDTLYKCPQIVGEKIKRRS